MGQNAARGSSRGGAGGAGIYGMPGQQSQVIVFGDIDCFYVAVRPHCCI
jgi:hypothetical protein